MDTDEEVASVWNNELEGDSTSTSEDEEEVVVIDLDGESVQLAGWLTDREFREEARDRQRRLQERAQRRVHQAEYRRQAMADAALQALLQQLIADRAADQVAAQATREASAEASAERNTEVRVRAQVTRIEKSDGEDKPKLRRWIRDITQVGVVEPGIAVKIATRTATGNLADTLEAYLADANNGARNAIIWNNLKTHVEGTLLGADYGRVLRRELAAEKQSLHETVTEFSERYLKKAKDAYEEPWADIVQETLVAQYAQGLRDTTIAREITITVPQATLRAALNRARSADMTAQATFKGETSPTIAVVGAKQEATPPEKEDRSKQDDPLAALAKQVASISTRLGEMKKGTNTKAGIICYKCDKPGHFARECRAGKARGNTPRSDNRQQPQRGESRQCYKCGKFGHIARDCRSQGQRQAPATAYGQQPPRPAFHGYSQRPQAQGQPTLTPRPQAQGQPAWTPPPPSQAPQQVAAQQFSASGQGNW